MNARHMKVLSGPNKGGNVLLPESGEFLIGTDDACDLVLCDPAVAARHAQLSLDGEIRLKPVEGAIRAGEHPLPADGVVVEDFQVYVLGDTWLCLGPAEGNWPTVLPEGFSMPAASLETLGGFASTDAVANAATALPGETACLPGTRPRTLLLKGKRPFFFAAAPLVLGLALWFLQSGPKTDEAFSQVQSLLERGSFAGLTLERDGDGNPVLKGWVDTKQRGSALEEMARAYLPSIVLEVHVTRTLVDDLSSRARRLGYTLQVIPEQAGFARIRGYVKDEAALENLRQGLGPELQHFAGIVWEMKTWAVVSDALARLAAARHMDFLRFEPRDAAIMVSGIENATGAWQTFLEELGDMLRIPIAFVRHEGGREAFADLALSTAGVEPDLLQPVQEWPSMEDLCEKLSRNPERKNSLLYGDGRTEYQEGALLPGGHRILHILPHGVFLARNATVYYCQ